MMWALLIAAGCGILAFGCLCAMQQMRRLTAPAQPVDAWLIETPYNGVRQNEEILERLERVELQLIRLTETISVKLEYQEKEVERQLMQIRQEFFIPTNGIGMGKEE